MTFKCLLAVLCITATVTSCNTNNSAYTKDKDYKEYSRTPSPDKRMVLLSYASHRGAFDYRIKGTAILKIADTAGNLVKYTLPRTLTHVTWINNNSVTAQYDIMPFIRRGTKEQLHDTTVNGVLVKVIANNNIEKDAQLHIIYRELSPDKKQEMVIYRYGNKTKPGYIHLSVIPVHGKVPQYGNYFIANPQADYINYARWSKNNRLIFFTDNVGKDLIYYGLVKNRPAIDYQIVADDDRYKGKNAWQGN